MTSLIVDASVAVKWHVLQDYSEEARALAGRAELFAPDLIIAEIANAIWKYVRAGQLAEELGREMLRKSHAPFSALFPVPPLQLHAFDLACALKHPVYDCFYLALAARESVPLVTADKRLASLGVALPGVEVRHLSAI